MNRAPALLLCLIPALTTLGCDKDRTTGVDTADVDPEWPLGIESIAACRDGSYPTEGATFASALCVTGEAYVAGVAYPTVEEAVGAASDGETVYVCPGTHAVHLAIAGVERTIEGVTGDPADVILDGGGTARILDAESSTLTLINLTLQGGKEVEDHGGAIQAVDSHLTIHCSVFSENQANDGGAIYIGGLNPAQVAIVDSVFAENRAAGQGGAVDFSSSGGGELMLQGSEFSANVSDDEAGALSIDGWEHEEVYVLTTTFSENTTEREGGAISMDSWDSGRLFVYDSAFSGNSARRSGGVALGGFAEGLEAEFIATRFDGNQSDEESSALGVNDYADPVTLALDGCTITNNVGAPAVEVSGTTTVVSADTHWGDGKTDNGEGDLTAPCGTYTTLGEGESFTCLPDGTWK